MNSTRVLGTITRTWGSAPRPPGSVVAVRDDGQIAGSVSGGCIEDDLIARMRARALAAQGVPTVVRYGVSADEAPASACPAAARSSWCSSRWARTLLDELLQRLERGAACGANCTLASGAVHAGPGRRHRRGAARRHALVTHLGPALALLIDRRRPDDAVPGADGAGAGLPGHRLRPARRVQPEVPGATVRTMPDDAVQALQARRHTAVIALTHDPKLDDLALMEALRSRPSTSAPSARAPTRPGASSAWPSTSASPTPSSSGCTARWG
jgi:xanthine dehydrogenase accessory factor